MKQFCTIEAKIYLVKSVAEISHISTFGHKGKWFESRCSLGHVRLHFIMALLGIKSGTGHSHFDMIL